MSLPTFLIFQEDVLLPEDFDSKSKEKERRIVLWLLNHNPESRPTAQELLDSGYIPPKLEDKQLDEILLHTLNQSNSSRYKRLTTALFKQDIDSVIDQIYDIDLQDNAEQVIKCTTLVCEYVEETLRGMFTRHGALSINTPLLIPKSQIFHGIDNVASVMDSNGIVLALPFDSRISFARLISYNSITNLKRFFVGNVYKDSRIHRSHPREIKECSFDIVFDTSGSMIPDAEVLSTVSDIIKEFPLLQARNYYVRINHSSLLKAILYQIGLSEEFQDKIYAVLQNNRNEKELCPQIRNITSNADLPEHMVSKLMCFLEFEGTISKAKEALQTLRKSRGLVGALAKQAFSDFDTLSKNCRYFGMDLPLYINTKLAYNIKYFSGILFQFVAANKMKRRHGGVDILAAGGRYDKLIERFRKSGDKRNLPHAVGVSIAVDKLISSVLEMTKESEQSSFTLCECDILICTVGNTTSVEQRLQTIHELWCCGLKVMLSSYDSSQECAPEELQEYCKESGIHHMVVLKDSDSENVRVRENDY